jgi:hypothetical protein
VSEWPPIGERELVQRLSLDDEGFEAFLDGLLGSFPRRDYEAAILARALAYPWARPSGPFHLVDGVVDALEDMGEEDRVSLCDRFTSDPGRYPVLAIGANGSPEGLERKFAHFPDAEDRTTLVLTGWLHDFDIGAAAQFPINGQMPATIFPSEGTAVRAALLWVTATQFTQLAWSEMGYRLGKLKARFEVDGVEEHLDEVLVFVSRFGTFHLGNGPVALAAILANGRIADALTQEEILDAAAELVLGPGENAEALVRAAFDDLGETARKAKSTVRRQSIPFVSDRWTPYGQAQAR